MKEIAKRYQNLVRHAEAKKQLYNESMNRDNNELFDKYLEAEHMYSFEGTEGVRQFEQLCEDLGYSRGQFIGASAILNFLADNSGAIEAMMEFIRDNIDGIPEWQDELGFDELEEEMEYNEE